MPKIPAAVLTAALAMAAPMMGQDFMPKATVAELIATLGSDASLEAKAAACRQLALVGTQEAVPALAALLADEKLAHMARYALEPIPDQAVDEALRAALGTLKGRRLVGVMCSIGARRDARAVPRLARLLADSDAEVAQAAARALGRVGTPEAARALEDALDAAPAANRAAVCEGLFRSATALAAQGRAREALLVYDRLRSLPGPQQVRGGALIAAILERREDGLPLLAESLRSPDDGLFAAAVRAAQQLPGPEVTPVLVAALAQLPEQRRIPVIQTLSRRGDPAAVDALCAEAKASAKAVRLVALRGLAELGGARSLPVLLETLAEADDELARAAQEGLAALPGPQADAAVMAMFAGADSARRLTAVELIGRRRMTGALGALVKAAEEADPQIRSAAIRKLGEMAGPAELPPLFEMLLRAQGEQDLAAVEGAIGGVVARLERPETHSGSFVALLAGAKPEGKAALLRILGATGGAAALNAVRASVGDPDAVVQAAAIRALGAWKTADAVPELLAVARSAGHSSHKTLALRAYLGWAGRSELAADQRLAICREAQKLAERVDQKRLLLSALGSLDAPGAVEMIVPYLAEAETKDEAAAAAVSLGERLLKQPDPALAARLVGPLEKVVQAAAAAHLAQRAKAALRQAQSKSRKK